MKPHFDRNAAKYMATCEKKRAWRETNAPKAKSKKSNENSPKINESW